jgi:hypothetical protein
MKKWLVLGLVSVILGGCATGPTYEERLQEWVGAKESVLIKGWGPPDATYELDGDRYVRYNKQRIWTQPGRPPSVREYTLINTTYKSVDPGTPSMTFHTWCKTTFKVRGGTIVSWEFEGNHCN